jgi:hypothetical protein
MPLNAKGKKILASMEKKYGKKKGKTVFYAMENSGKLKRIKKAYSGDFMTAETSNSMYESGRAAAQSFQDSYQGSDGGNNQQTTGSKTTTTTTKDSGSGGSNLVNIGKSLLTQGAAKLFDLPSMGITLASKAIKPIQQALTPKTVKDTANARLSGSFTTKYDYKPTAPNITGGDNTPTQLCPDGTTPPCKTPTTQIKNPVSTPNPFLSGFKAYDDGGEVVISSNVDKDLL